MDLNPTQIVTLTILAMFAAATFDLGMAFLFRAPRETGFERD